MQKQQPDFVAISRQFQFSGHYLDAQPYGTGHINDTYLVRFQQPGPHIQRYILQRINQNIFKRPEAVMHNMQLVTSHLRDKISAAGGDPKRETLTLIPAIDGKSFYQTPTGEFWRATIFIEGAHTYLKAEHLYQYYHAARAFGRFLALLTDLPTDRLIETIPDFHHTPKRFYAFTAAVEKDDYNRASSVRQEIEFVMHRAHDTGILINLLESGTIPLRVVHNDAKLDNVMIDNQSGAGICVVDLDTVMPGPAVLDFGDAVRSAANTAVEDEQDLTKVSLDLEIFERLAGGFLDEARDFLTPIELDHLAFGARLITLEQTIRFLTDHLNGDIYYKTSRENHNLDRTRTQIELLGDMESKYDQMLKIVEKYC